MNEWSFDVGEAAIKYPLVVDLKMGKDQYEIEVFGRIEKWREI